MRITGVFLVTLALLAGTARAATFDVTTVPGLQAALAAAQSNGQDDVIRLAMGEYVGCFSHVPSAAENFDLTLQGGWDSGFTGRSTQAEYTVLDGNLSCRPLTLNAANGTTGDFTVEGVKVTLGYSVQSGGGALVATNPPGRVTVDGCRIENNTSSANVGGLFVYSFNAASHTGGVVTVANCLIRNNTVNGSGGGLYAYNAEALFLYNNVVYGNQSLGWGGGIVVTNMQGSAHVANNTVTDNTAGTLGCTDCGGAGIYLSHYGPGWGNNHAFLFNNIVRGNRLPDGTPADIHNADSATVPAAGNSVTVVNNDFADLASAPGAVEPVLEENIDADPLFDQPAWDPLSRKLSAGSPCVDAGTNWAPFLPERDFEGELRIMDGGAPGSPIVDIGADERYASYPRLTLIVPNGREVLVAEQTYPVRWASPGAAAKFKLFLSTDGGESWRPITPDFITGTLHSWTVPAQAANRRTCLLRVNGYTDTGAPAGADVSNDPFTIEVLRLVEPNGGESVDTGDVATISWAAASNYEQFRLFYSLDNGLTWKPVEGTTLAPAGAAAPPPLSFVVGRSFEWAVPTLRANNRRVRVKVTGYDAGARRLGSDASDRPFEVAVVKLLAPNGGETWRTGEPHDVTWEANATVRDVDAIRVQYSVDNGGTWKAVGTAAPGEVLLPWTIPAVRGTKAQSRARVQLLDARGAVIGSDASDRPFTLSRD